MGFFTDTSVCIGCKACEVACKEWNEVPDDGYRADRDVLRQHPGARREHLAARRVRREAACTRPTDRPRAARHGPAGLGHHGAAASGRTRRRPPATAGVRWLMSSDVCKHCTHAACLDVCPTGSLFRTEFGTVVVQPDICNGCGYCVPACPYGVIDLRKDDGRAFKCTLCYDRLKDGQTPACAQACPTESIQFGELDELRERADARVAELHEQGRRRRPALRRRPRGRRRRRRRVLPAARRAGGLRAAARPGGDHPRPRLDLEARRRRRGRAGRRSASPRSWGGADEPASETRDGAGARSSSPTTAGRSSRRRPGRRPTSRSTCSSAGWPAPPRCSPRARR